MTSMHSNDSGGRCGCPDDAPEFIICYSTPLIAEDISAGITEWDPAARVRLCQAPDELPAMLETAKRVFALIASAPPSDLDRAGLLRALGA